MDGKPYLREGTTISDEDRSSIMKGIKELVAYLLPAPDHRKAVAVELAQLVNAFPREQMGDKERKHRFEAYQRALENTPAWAIAMAREDIIAGKIRDLDMRWCPTPPQLRTACLRYTETAMRDMEDLRILRDAPVFGIIEPENKQLVIDGFDDLKREMRATSHEARMYDLANYAAVDHIAEMNETLRVRDCIAAGVDPDLNCSAALAKKLGMRNRHEQDDKNHSDGTPPGNTAFDH